MPDDATQRAINDTLRNIRTRLREKYARNRRLRDARADAQDAPLLSERMHCYTQAIAEVDRHIRPIGSDE